MATTRPRNETQQLYPARILRGTDDVISDQPPPAGVPVQGVPLEIFENVLRNGTLAPAVKVRVDPPLDPEEYVEMTLWLNGVRIGNAPVGDKSIDFDMFQSGLRDGITNVIQYKLKRHSGNESESTELWALYSATLPGGNDVPGNGEHPGLGISLPAEWGDPANIDKDKIDKKVPLTLAYSHMKAHDKVTVEIGNERFDYTVKPGEVGASFVALIDREQFELVGSQDNCPFRYTVVDQLLNAAHKRRWSKIIRANVDVDGVTLGKPILREILNDSEDVATEIDLGKLASNELLVVVLTSPGEFKKDDKIKAEYIAKLEGHPDVVEKMEGTVEADEFGEKKRCILKVPNAKVIAGSSVTVTYALFTSNNVPVGKSEVATAIVVGEALPPAVLAFTNAPYEVDTGGELGPVNLRLTRDDIPVANATVSLTLPEGFTYSKAEGETRDFTTDAKGEVSVTGIKGAEAEGEFEFVAVSKGAPLISAKVTVTSTGPVGVIDMTYPQKSIVITSDGTRIYVDLDQMISVINTKTNNIIGHIAKPSHMNNLDRILISKENKKIYAPKIYGNISIFDATSYKLLKNITLTFGFSAMNRDGTRLSHLTHEGAISTIDTETDNVVNTLQIPPDTYPILYNFDGSVIYLKNITINRGCYAINAMTGAKISQYTFSDPITSTIYGIYLSADGEHIYLNIGQMLNNNMTKSLIVVLDASNLKEERRITLPDYSRISTIFSDHIYIQNTHTTSIGILQINSGQIIRHIEVGHQGSSGVGRSVCTPDERRLYACNNGGPLMAVVPTGM